MPNDKRGGWRENINLLVYLRRGRPIMPRLLRRAVPGLLGGFFPMNVTVKCGATRCVLLWGNRSYKFPSLHSWKHFLLGLLANMQEAAFGRTGWPELCPVLWAAPGGFLVVMKRAEVCSEANFITSETYWLLTRRDAYTVPAEFKPSSWGYLGGRLVAIDYGS